MRLLIFINMASTHFIIYHKQHEDEGIVLDGFKCAYKGDKDDMTRVYREFFNKAKKLVELGQATDLKESYDDDGTLSFKFTRNGIVMKTFLCERKRAAWLLA